MLNVREFLRAASTEPSTVPAARRPSWVERASTLFALLLTYGLLLWYLKPSLLLTPTITAGGDTISHYVAAKYLRDYLLPHGKLIGWMPGNFAGYPLFLFYFPLAFLLIAALSLAVPFPVAFKLGSLSGTFALPICSLLALRWIGCPFPIPALGAVLTLPFLLNEGNSMWGGNIPSTLAGEFSHVLIDDGAHASLRDAAAMLECPVIRFRHRDPDDLIRALRRIGASTRPVVLTDGIFPSDGAIAPLGAYMNSLPAKGRVWVDDAHAAGVLGRSGQGTAEHLGLPTDRIIRTVTLSKAFGVYGGVALGSLALRQQIVTKSRAFVGNTPMPLPLAGAALRAVEILADSKDRRTRLAEHVSSVKERLQATGLTLEDTPSPIIALTPKGQADAARCRRLLLARHIYSPLMHYPGGPDGGYFRIALSSEHSQGQLDQLVRAVGDCVQAGWLH